MYFGVSYRTRNRIFCLCGLEEVEEHAWGSIYLINIRAGDPNIWTMQGEQKSGGGGGGGRSKFVVTEQLSV